MKIRSGFVSNSSSSSFVVWMHYLTPLQVTQIYDHINLGRTLGIDYAHPDAAWKIGVSNDGKRLHGCTTMNNFDMEDLFRLIGVPMNHVSWSDKCWLDLDS